jgi:hypothetical protein
LALPAGNTGAVVTPVEETVCVWAVDGLGDVSLSGLPRGGVSTQRGSSGGPRAVLWGRDSHTVKWLRQRELAEAQDLR